MSSTNTTSVAQTPRTARFISTEDFLAKSITTILHAGDTASLKTLLQAKPDLIAALIGDCNEARTLLHVLTDFPGNFPNAPESARILLDAGANPNARFLGEAHSETPLHWAASRDDVPVLDVLLDAGADIDAGGGVVDETPLADARAFLQLKAAHRLVERGARVTLQDASMLGLLDRVKTFYGAEAGEKPSQEETDLALWNACHGGQLGVVEYLFERGAALDTVPPWEELTPLDAARRNGAQDLVTWLRERGAKEYKKDG
ncbi:hypothetical protein ED733_005182 [Metarhizium rileyi]|uniref:Uncharacterized protein n=1 Tax=Metarhizium rileyi (strain RCEF 4871) TaxID=1649241 RepID=A0A5C6G9H1_METRR|nr:hypothetical protein ED733_005182 [Metarhizium rileyi]